MKRKQSWPSPLLLAALLTVALTPVVAIAGRGDRPTDLPGEPSIVPIEYEFGDPEPGSHGSQQWGDLELWKQILLASMRNATLVLTRPSFVERPRATDSSVRASRGSNR